MASIVSGICDAGTAAYDGACSFAGAAYEEAAYITGVFSEKAPKIDFLYANMKLYTDAIYPVVNEMDWSLGPVGDAFQAAVKGPLKGFTAFATLGKSHNELVAKVNTLYASMKSEDLEKNSSKVRGEALDAGGAIFGQINKVHDVVSFGGRLGLTSWAGIAARTTGLFFASLSLGSAIRTATSAEKAYVNWADTDGIFGNKPASDLRAERVISAALSALSNAAIGVISTSLFLKEIAVISAINPMLLLGLGVVAVTCKVAKYYYDARVGIDKDKNLPKPPGTSSSEEV